MSAAPGGTIIVPPFFAPARRTQKLPSFPGPPSGKAASASFEGDAPPADTVRHPPTGRSRGRHRPPSSERPQTLSSGKRRASQGISAPGERKARTRSPDESIKLCASCAAEEHTFPETKARCRRCAGPFMRRTQRACSSDAGRSASEARTQRFPAAFPRPLFLRRAEHAGKVSPGRRPAAPMRQNVPATPFPCRYWSGPPARARKEA